MRVPTSFASFQFLPKLFAALLVGGCALAAQAGVNIEHWTTAAGTRVYFVESRSLPILDVQVDFPAGAAYDPATKAGVAGMTASLVHLGAAGLDENAIANRLADLGARFGGSHDQDRASFSLRTLVDKDKREPALKLLADILRAPDFAAPVVAREKGRAITALKDALTRPDTLAGQAFSPALYGDHPYGRVTTPESLAGIGRADLVAFHRGRYRADVAVVTIVGDVAKRDAQAIAEQLTGKLPKTGPAATLPAVKLPAGGERRVAHPAAQAHVLIGVPAVKRGDPDLFPLLVGNYVLGGGGFVSRLTKEVREKRGFAYSVYSYFMPAKELGAFQIGLQTKREQVGEALGVVRETLAGFLAEGPSAEELTAAKANLVGSFPLRLDSNRKILENVAVIGFYGLPLDWLDKYRERVAAVSVADIRAAFARKVQPGQLMTVIVGPAS